MDISPCAIQRTDYGTTEKDKLCTYLVFTLFLKCKTNKQQQKVLLTVNIVGVLGHQWQIWKSEIQ